MMKEHVLHLGILVDDDQSRSPVLIYWSSEGFSERSFVHGVSFGGWRAKGKDPKLLRV